MMNDTLAEPTAVLAVLDAGKDALSAVVAPFRAVPCGLVIDRPVTFAEWQDAGQRLYALGSWSQWALGDWVLAGEHAFGEMAAQAYDLTKRSYQSVANAASVCRRFPLSRRRETVSFSHHAEVVALEPDAADRLLDDAERYQWPRETLRGEVRALKGGPKDVSTADALDDDGAEDVSGALESELKPHVSHNSGNHEWYTPPEIIEAARAVLGVFDLDPASSAEANTVVQAERFYTIEDDGLGQSWSGRVWLNPPYSQPEIVQFCEKLAAHVRAGDVSAAIVLVNNATETGWYRALTSVAAAVFFPAGRIKFWSRDRETTSPLQGQAVLYIGPHVETFTRVFATLDGDVWLRPAVPVSAPTGEADVFIL